MTTTELNRQIAEGCAELARKVPARDALKAAVRQLEESRPLELDLALLGLELPVSAAGGPEGAW